MEVQKEDVQHPVCVPSAAIWPVFDAYEDQICLLDAAGRIAFTNKAWRSFGCENNLAADYQHIGTDYIQTCLSTPDEDGTAAAAVQGIRQVMHEGGMFRMDYPCHSPEERRWFELTVRPLTLDSGEYLIVGHRNVSHRHNELGIERDVNLLVQGAMLGEGKVVAATMLCDLDGRITSWSSSAELAFGIYAEAALGARIQDLFDNLPSLQTLKDLQLGETVDLGLTKAKGRDQRYLGVALKVSSPPNTCLVSFTAQGCERQELENARIASGELIHRLKNIYATIIAIARQSAKSATDLPGYVDALVSRVHAMSRASQLVTEKAHTAIYLDDIVEGSLLPLISRNANYDRVGDNVIVHAQAIQAFSMALYELASNSLKYGALGSSGSVTLRSSVDADNAAVIEWTEHSPVISSVTPRRGFGTSVLTTFVERATQGSVDYQIGDGVVTWSVRFFTGSDTQTA